MRIMLQTTKALRKTGLEVLGDRPWGTHFCVFYETDEDLMQILMPYFKAGIENNERCFWVIADSIDEREARYAVKSLAPRSQRQVLHENMEFLRSEECYLKEGIFSLERVTSEWSERMQRAVAAGYDGIRVSGYAGWPQTREWPGFWKYEGSLNESITGLPMMVLCTYALSGSAGTDVLDVAHTHQCAVSRRSGNWEVIETAALKAAKEEIEKLNRELEQRVLEGTRELTLAQAELSRIARLTTMGQLATSITHEIAQPIAAMVTDANACLHWLTNNPPELDEARGCVQRVVKEGQRAGEVFRSIRSLVQRAKPRMSPLNINDVIAEGLALTASALEQESVLVNADLAATLPELHGDRVQLQQVLVNVITNAIQAMSRVRTRQHRLTIRSRLEDDGILITIEDTGSGLDPARRDQIFGNLFTTKPEGMGIGLSISRSIVTAHQGRMWAEPGPSCGAIFSIHLPLQGAGQALP
jgi:signal transduction histidine kinase